MAKEPVDGSTPGGSYSPGIAAEGRFMYVSGQVAGRDGHVYRYSPAGELTEVIEVPAARVSCCAFGGPDLRTLDITTAAGQGSPAAACSLPGPAWPATGPLVRGLTGLTVRRVP